jgi:hypothetical protein
MSVRDRIVTAVYHFCDDWYSLALVNCVATNDSSDRSITDTMTSFTGVDG